MTGWSLRPSGDRPLSEPRDPVGLGGAVKLEPGLSEVVARGVRGDLNLSLFYETFLKDQVGLGKILPPADPVHRALAEWLDKTVSALGGNPRDFTLHVLRDPTINAFVFRGVDPAPVFIMTGFIGALADRHGGLTKGHLGLIFGHESAHVREGAYKPPGPIDRVISRNPFFESRRAAIDGLEDDVSRLIVGRAGGRNEEYTCDRYGLIAARRLGATEREPIEVLELLAEPNEAPKSPRYSKPSHLSPYAAVVTDLLATHPASQRRVDRGEGHQHLLSVQGEHPRANPAREIVLTAAAIAPVRALTPLQVTLAAFTTELVGAQSCAESQAIIRAALGNARDITALHQIALIAGLHQQAKMKADFSRFDSPLTPEASDDDRSASRGRFGSIRVLDRDLLVAADRRVGELSPGELSPIEQQVVQGVVAASLGGRTALLDVVEPPTLENVGETIAAVARLGRVPFEGSTLNADWLKMIQGSSAASDAAEVIAARAFDQRAPYLSTLVLHEILGRATPVDVMSRILGEFAAHVPTLLTGDGYFRKELMSALKAGVAKSHERWPDPPTLEGYRRARALNSGQIGDPFCVALPLAPVLHQAGRTGDTEVLKAMVEDHALPAKTRSILGVIFLNARLFDPAGAPLSMPEAVAVVRETLRESGFVVEPVPVTDRFPTSHSQKSGLFADVISEDYLEGIKYEDLPVYSQGFARALALVAKAGGYLPNAVVDKDDIGLSLIGAFPNRQREDLEIEAEGSAVSVPPELVRQFYYALASAEKVRESGVSDRVSATADMTVRRRLALSIRPLLEVHAATVDLAAIKNRDMGRLIESTREAAGSTDPIELLRRAREAVLPALAEAREYSARSRHDVGAHLATAEQLRRNTEQILTLYTDYRRFSEARLTPRSSRATSVERVSTPDSLGLENIAFLAGRSLFDLSFRYGPPELAKEYAAKTPAEKVACIFEHFIDPSTERDEHLLGTLQEIPATDNHIALKRVIFEALYNPLHAKRLGLDLFDVEVRNTPHASALERLEHVLTYLPSGSSRRDVELRRLYDGTDGVAGLVTGWSDHHAVQARLARDEKENEPGQFLRGTGVDILLDAIHDPRISASERARVLLWVAGLRESTTLVECFEVATNRKISDLRKESELLTTDEKESILYEALAGSAGILREDGPGRDIFLNALFIGIFNPLTANPETLRQCKACFDTMMKLDEPERAARFLATCMVGYLDKLSEPEQVKLLFSSYGALGPKAAQQIIARTNLFDAPTRRELMDLTSRVPGGSSAELYAALERTYGQDAEWFVKDIRPVGGGSFQQVWEVTFWNDDHSGPGDRLICCKLRPDVVTDLAGDLRTTQGLADAMEAAPALFGGAHLNRRAGQGIALQSALETNYDFLVAQQEGARREVADIRWSKHEPRIAIPEVVRTHRYIAEDGSTKTVELTNGELIFMRRAAGATLDRYLIHNPADQKSISRALAQFAVHQALNGGHLHCDLHPGNIIVDRGGDGTLTLSLIDWGISAKTPQLVSDGMRHILSIAAGARGEELSWRSLVKTLVGAGRVDAAAGTKALADFVYVLGVAGGGTISAERAEALGAKLYTALNQPESSIQARLQAIEPILAEAGVRMPLAVDYMLRGLGTLTYVWSDLGESEIWGILKGELKRSESAARAGTIDRRALTEVFTTIGAECGIDTAEISAAIARVRAAKDRNAQLAGAVAELRAMYAFQGDRDGAIELVSKLTERGSDLGVRLGRALGVEEPGVLLDELYAIDRLALSSGAEFARALPPLEQVRGWCETEAIGQVMETWSMPLHPGTIVRVTGPGQELRRYLILYGAACESPRQCRVVSLDSGQVDSATRSRVDEYLGGVHAPSRRRRDSVEGEIRSVRGARHAPSALIELMNSFDTEGVTIGHLLSDETSRVEYFTGTEWRDLRALRLA